MDRKKNQTSLSSEIAPYQKVSQNFRNDNVRVNRLVIQTHLFVALAYEVLHA